MLFENAFCVKLYLLSVFILPEGIHSHVINLSGSGTSGTRLADVRTACSSIRVGKERIGEVSPGSHEPQRHLARELKEQ